MTNRHSLRQHLHAGAIHLALSVAVAVTTLLVVFRLWSPGALAQCQGVDHLLPILIGVDVVLGPLLTTILYVPGKKGLWFDLVVVAVLQLGALAYGIHTILGGRPAYVVFNVDRFDVVAVQEINRESLARAQPQWHPSWRGPLIVATNGPAEKEERERIMMSAVSGGADLPQLPEYFEPLANDRDAIVQHLRPLAELRELNEIDDAAWRRLAEQWGGSEASMGYLPMRANERDGAVIIDRATGSILSIEALEPQFEAPKTPPA